MDLTTSSASPQEIVIVGAEIAERNQNDAEDDQDPEIEESVNELLSKCEEVGEGLRKQVELAVIEQPKCVGSDKLRLKKYQLVGLSWLNNLHMRGVNGILAGKIDFNTNYKKVFRARNIFELTCRTIRSTTELMAIFR